jgi:hypothetical protein
MADLARAVEIYASVHFALMGLSHLFRPLSWVRFFKILRDQGTAGVFAHGWLSLFFGAMIVSFHDVWSGPDTTLTVAGWLYVAKAAACFLSPNLQLVSLGRVSDGRKWELQLAGAAYLLLALWLIVHISEPSQ